MNTSEFKEWLEKGIARMDKWRGEATDEFERGHVAGYSLALRQVRKELARLTSLDSSHDLPSTKG